MSTPSTPPNPLGAEPVARLARLAEAAAAASAPQTVFAAADAAMKELIGHRLFTLLFVVPGGAEVERIYSSDPVAYPLTGRKPMGPTPWGEHVIVGRRAWLGRDMEAIRWAFFDHALIASLGCGTCINVPVCALGEVVGTMNILDREHAFDERHVALAQAAAPALAPAFLAVMGRLKG
jgi:hypothetical protein